MSIINKSNGDTEYPIHVKYNRPLPLCQNLALPLLALAGTLLICCLFPQVQQWIAGTIKHIETGQMSLGNAIVLIGVPSIAGTLLITGIVLFVKKHHRRSFETLQDGSFWDVLDTLKSCASKKKWVVGALTIASFIVAGLAIGYLQPFPHILGHPIKIWQGLTCFGGGGFIITVLSSLSYALVKNPGFLFESDQYDKELENHLATI